MKESSQHPASSIEQSSMNIIVKSPLNVNEQKISPFHRITTTHAGSLQDTLLANLRKRQNRVSFTPHFPLDEEKQNIQQENPNKRRRFQRRNSKTAAMLFPPGERENTTAFPT